MNWVIVIQSRKYYADNLYHVTDDFDEAAIFRKFSKEEMEERLDNLPGLKYSKCMRRAVPYEKAKQEYFARIEEEKVREKHYADFLSLAEKQPDRIITVAVKKPFVGKLTASASEAVKVIENKWFDFEVIDN